MSLIFRFLDATTGLVIADTPVEKASISAGLNKSSEWDTVLSANIEATQYLEKGNLIEIYYQGRLLMSGTLQTFGISLEDDTSVNLKGRDVLDGLQDYRGYNRAMYKDVLWLMAVAELLDQAGWAIGDITTFPDPTTQKISADLRTERTIAAQISKAVALLPKVNYRYGGVRGGKHTLDFGVFQESTGLEFYSPPSGDEIFSEALSFSETDENTGFVGKLSFNTTLEEIVWALEAYGGEVTDNVNVKRAISLYDALNDVPTRITDSDYPILELAYKQSYLMYDRARAPYVGGRMEYSNPGADGSGAILPGNSHGATAGLSYHYVTWFYPAPGRLTRISGFTANNVSIPGTINQDLRWWVHEEGVQPTPGNVLATGVLAPASFVSGWATVSTKLVSEVPVDQQVILEPGTRYALRIGFDAPGGFPITTYRRMKSVAGASAMLTATGQAVSTDNGGSYAAYAVAWWPFIIETTPVNPPMGGQLLERKNEIAPEKAETSASLADCKATGTQLWTWGKAYLQDHDGGRTTYDLDVIGDTPLPTLGDTVFVRGQAEGTFVDPFTDDTRTYRVLVEKNLRVDGYKLEYDSDKVTIGFEVTEGNGISNEDAWVQSYDASRKAQPLEGTMQPGLWVPGTSTTSTPVAAADADTTMSDGSPGKLVQIAYPTAPSVLHVIPLLAGLPYGTATRGRVMVELVTRPDHATLTGAVVKVKVSKGWEFGDTTTLTTLYLWY